jgi:hypothetical protein
MEGKVSKLKLSSGVSIYGNNTKLKLNIRKLGKVDNFLIYVTNICSSSQQSTLLD